MLWNSRYVLRNMLAVLTFLTIATLNQIATNQHVVHVILKPVP